MQKTAQKVDLTYLAVFIASAAGCGLSLLAALLFGGSGLFSLVARQMEPHAMLGLSGGMLLISLICLPGLVLSFLHLNGRPLPAWPVLRFPAGMAALAILVLFVVAIFIGTFTSTINLGALVFPLAVMLAAVLPLLFYILIGARGLSLPGPMRTASSAVLSVTAVMPMAFTIEMVLLLLALLLVGLRLSAQPDLLNELMEQMNTLGTDLTTAQVSSLIQRPGVIPGVLFYTCVLAPFIEELLKPLAVWLLAWRKPSPAQGFVLGMLGGACFALIEAISALSMPDASGGWWAGAVARSGTGLLHVAASGLMGWAIAAAFQRRKFLPLVGAYAASVLLHSAWNFFGTLQGLQEYVTIQPWSGFAAVSVPVLIVLSLILLAILLLINARLRREAREIGRL